MATELQELVRNLQLDFQGEDELQRVCHRIQDELYALEQRARPKASPPVQLTPKQQEVWSTFQAFLATLCGYSGWVNRDQWLQLLDVAADLLAAGSGGTGTGTGPQGPQGPPGAPGANGVDGITPHIQGGTWWLGTTDTGVPVSGGAAFPEAPNTPGTYYLRDGSTQSWVSTIDAGLYS